MIQLPKQLWYLRDAFRAQGFDMRLVGGTVRDALLNLTPKDVDLHTDATPDECIQIYNATGVRWEPTGIDHGTITVIFDHVGYEITSLREDVATDGRRAVVKYTKDWRVDAERRDFTINSMSMSFEGDILDPFQGLQDLHEGVVRFVGDAETRIQEDFLRILRWFRFRGRFGLTPDPQAVEAVRAHAAGLQNISCERVWMEISKILSGDHAVSLMRDLHVLGVDRHVGLSAQLYKSIMHTDTYAQHVHALTRNPVTMLVALCSNWAAGPLTRWKASNDQIKLANFLWENLTEDPFKLMATQGVSREWALELLMLSKAMAPDVHLLKGILEEWQVPVFPVTGYDLIKLGMKPGPDYGRILAHLKDVWATQGYMMDKGQLLHLVKMDLESHM